MFRFGMNVHPSAIIINVDPTRGCPLPTLRAYGETFVEVMNFEIAIKIKSLPLAQ